MEQQDREYAESLHAEEKAAVAKEKDETERKEKMESLRLKIKPRFTQFVGGIGISLRLPDSSKVNVEVDPSISSLELITSPAYFVYTIAPRALISPNCIMPMVNYSYTGVF